jgi:uncharacterized protein YdaU (DUF1376 family)
VNYYERHLGDYTKDTAHLTMLEQGAYNLLLDRYYGTEKGIPADQVYRVTRANTKQERSAVNSVLKEFFRLRSGIWIKDRCEQEIAAARKRIQAAIENGKRGGRPKTQQEPTGLGLGTPSQTQIKALQTPDSNLHTNKIKSDQKVVSRKEELRKALPNILKAVPK